MARKRKAKGDDPSSLPWSSSYGQADLPWVTGRNVHQEQAQAEGQAKRQAIQNKLDELKQIQSDLKNRGKFGGIKDIFSSDTASDKLKRLNQGREADDKRGVGERLKDSLFDANTEADKKKRTSKGKAENYQDEDGRGYSSIGGKLKDVFIDANSGRDKTVRRERGDPELHQDFRKSEDDKVKRAGEGKLTDEEKKQRADFNSKMGIDPNAKVELGTPMPKGTELFTNKGVNKLAINQGAQVQKEADAKTKRVDAEKTFQNYQDAELGRQGGFKQAGRGFAREFVNTFIDLPSNLQSIASNAVDMTSPEGSRIDKWAQQQFDNSVNRVNKRQEKNQLSGVGSYQKDNSLISGLSGGAGSLAAALTMSALTGGVGAAAKGSEVAKAADNLTKAQKAISAAKNFASIKGVAPKIFTINTTGQSVRDLRAEGKDPLQAFVTSGVAGYAEGKLEEFGLDKLVNPVSTNILKQFATTSLSEGAQEFSQTAISNVIASTYKHVDLQKALNDSVMAGLYGSALGGIAGVPFTFSARLQQEGVPQHLADKAAHDLTVSIDKGAEKTAGYLRQQAEEEGALEVAQPEQELVEAPIAQDEVNHITRAGNLPSIMNEGRVKIATPDSAGYEGQNGVYLQKGIDNPYGHVGEDNIKIVYDNAKLPQNMTVNGDEIAVHEDLPFGTDHVKRIEVANENLAKPLREQGFDVKVDPSLSANQEQVVKPTPPKVPEGFSYDNDGNVLNPEGNIATQPEVQKAIQDAKGEGFLTEYENASKTGDTETMARIAKEHPGDKRVKMPEKGRAKPIVEKNARKVSKPDTLRDVPIADFKNTDSTSWNEATQNVGKGQLSKASGPVEVVLTKNGYKLIEGNHRAVQALNRGDATIKARVISKEGLDEIAKRDGPHVKVGMQDSYTQEQLDAEFNKKPKVATLHLNEAEGSKKFTPGLAKRVEAKAIEDGIISRTEDISSSDSIVIKKEVAQAAELVNSDIERARRILRGEEDLPSNIRPTALVAAVTEYLKLNPNAELLRDVVNSDAIRQSSLAAQEINIAKAIDPDSATARLRDLAAAKRRALEKRSGLKGEEGRREVAKSIKKVAKEARKTIKPPTKTQFDEFLEEIKCG